MKITKKSNKKNANYLNTEYKNIDDLIKKIKDIDYKINEINYNINKKENDIKNIINEKERLLNDNKNNNKNNISIKGIEYDISNINKRLDEIIKILNNEIKNNNKDKEILNNNKSKNIIVCQDNICISPTSLEKNKIPVLIDDFFILGKFKEENKIQKIEEFELNKIIKNKNKNYKIKNFPIIKKNIVYQIKRVETFEIIKTSNWNKENKKYFYGNKRLPIIKKPLSYQIINQLYIPGINNHEDNNDIQKVGENELLRIYLPIPEFVIEDINDFVLYPLKKNPLLIQYNSQIEFKSKK